MIASLTALAVAYLGGITSVSGAVTAGVMATSGVAFFAMGEVMGAFGTWQAFIGGVLLIVTTIQYPQGIAGALRERVTSARPNRPPRGLRRSSRHVTA
jgi:branched-chain amino acid transport system permease protein